MKRRGFLGFLGGAVASGPTLAKSIADTTLADAGYSNIGLNAAATPVPAMSSVANKSTAGRIVKWIQKNGVPEWKMARIRERVNHQRVFGIDPDLACLRSVSPGYKAREQTRRNLDRAIAASIASIALDVDRQTFFDKVKAKFGGYVEWYD
jgi:hypothetical protein